MSSRRNMAKVNSNPQQAAEIMCAMTDEQYHELSDELSAIEGMLELVHAPAEAEFLGLQIGLRVIGEKVKAAQDLMQAAWNRTREAHHA